MLSKPQTETKTAVTAKGHRVEMVIAYDSFERIEEIVIQAWDNEDRQRISTQQLTAFALKHLRHPILASYRTGVDGDGNGYALGIYT